MYTFGFLNVGGHDALSGDSEEIFPGVLDLQVINGASTSFNRHDEATTILVRF